MKLYIGNRNYSSWSFRVWLTLYAPIVNRLQIYALSTAPPVLRYTQALTRLEPWQAWAREAAVESWVVDIDEVYA